MPTYKIVDIADEIYRELGEPTDLSHASIAFWLRANIGDLNILINKKFYIDENTLEISIPENSGDSFSTIEKSIFKMIYSIHYYEKLFRNALGAASVDSVVSVTDDGSTVVKINKNELAKNYAQLRKQINEELMTLTKNYNINESRPMQVAGDDTIEGLDLPYKYGNPRSRKPNNGT
jgi:hypothetical protein